MPFPFSDEFVSARFLNEYPEEKGRWITMDEREPGKKSPQSGQVLKQLNMVYGSLDDAWDAGWRHMLLPHNHQWYPPHFDDATNSAMVTALSRGGMNKGSLMGHDEQCQGGVEGRSHTHVKALLGAGEWSCQHEYLVCGNVVVRTSHRRRAVTP